MSNTTGRLARSFLLELNQGNSKDAFEYLTNLLSELENKNDPEPTEVRLVAQIYSFVEKLEILKSNLGSYVTESLKNLPGNKLSDLWENTSIDGSAKTLK